MLKEIEIPTGITVKIDKTMIKITGPKGEVTKNVATKLICFDVGDNKIVIRPVFNESKNEKKMINTYRAHIKNMITGVTQPYTYKLKVCNSHFPMNVKVAGNKLEVNNYIGEKTPRILRIKEGSQVKVEGDIITVTSASIEIAGHVASDIERLMKRSAFDKRVFQDGIYIIEKCGVPLK